MHLRTNLTIPICMAALLSPFLSATAQPHLLGDRAQLLNQHYGVKATGNPPAIRYQPKPDEGALFENYESGPLETTVDTTFSVGGFELVVLFRTQVPRDTELMFCESCSDRIDVARMGYDDNDRPTVKQAFTKGFFMQGTLEGQPKPDLVLINDWPSALKIVSTEGYMGANTTTEHYFSFPELKPILQVATQEFTETRGGPDGPQSTLTQRAVRFIPEDEENTGLYEVEVTSTTEEGGAGTSTHYQWSESQHKFVPKAAPPPARKPVASPARKN